MIVTLCVDARRCRCGEKATLVAGPSYIAACERCFGAQLLLLLRRRQPMRLMAGERA